MKRGNGKSGGGSMVLELTPRAKRKYARQHCPRCGSKMAFVLRGSYCSQSGCTFTRGRVPKKAVEFQPLGPIAVLKKGKDDAIVPVPPKPRCSICNTQTIAGLCAREPFCDGVAM